MELPPTFGPDLKVLVLAGSDPAPARYAADPRGLPLGDKAFVHLHGRPVVDYALEVIRDCGLKRVWVLGPEAHLAELRRVREFTPILQPPGARFFANLTAASKALPLGAAEPVLIVFGDHPLQSPAALHTFLRGCSEGFAEADLFHALALQADYQEYAPWFRRTSVHMREMHGRASGFSLMVPSRLHHLEVLGQVYDVRKLERIESFFRLMVRLPQWLGLDGVGSLVDAVLVYLAKEMEKAARGSSGPARTARRVESWCADRVPARRLERYAARVLGAERGVRIIPVAHGGIAIDVDYADELATLEAHWDAIREVSLRQDARLAALLKE